MAALRGDDRIDLSSSDLRRRASTFRGKTGRSPAPCRAGRTACRSDPCPRPEIPFRPCEVGPAGPVDGVSLRAAAHARSRVLRRKVHWFVAAAARCARVFDHHASADRRASAGDKPMVNVAIVSLFSVNLRFTRRGSFDGAVFLMNLTTRTIDGAGVSVLRRAADFVELTKPRIVLMVLVTACVGFYVGSERIPNYVR